MGSVLSNKNNKNQDESWESQFCEQKKAIQKSMKRISKSYYINNEQTLRIKSTGDMHQGYSVMSKQYGCIQKIIDTYDQTYDNERFNSIRQAVNEVHGNVVRVLEVERMGNWVLVFKEEFKGQFLDITIGKQAFSQTDTLRLFNQLISLVTHLLKKNKILTNICPNFIIIEEDGTLKLDNIWETVRNEKERANYMPMYSAPEITQFGEGNTEKSMVWSCAHIVYLMLTGNYLFEGIDSLQNLKNEQKTINAKDLNINDNLRLSKQWKQILKRMLAYEPMNRPSLLNLKAQLIKMKFILQNSLSELISFLLTELIPSCDQALMEQVSELCIDSE